MTVPADVLTRPFQADGTMLISGVQALVRLMLAQTQSDRRAGLLTGGFVSGYRGSPLGTLDATFAKAAALCEAANIRVKPAIAAQFEGRPRLSFHMAPPLLSGRDPVTGELRKRRFGGWMMPVLRLLARVRFLRGTRLDPFGLMEERRIERALVVEYEALLDKIASDLTADRLPRAIEIAALPLEVRGYGSVKLASIERYRAKLAARLAEYDVPAEPAVILDGLEIPA